MTGAGVSGDTLATVTGVFCANPLTSHGRGGGTVLAPGGAAAWGAFKGRAVPAREREAETEPRRQGIRRTQGGGERTEATGGRRGGRRGETAAGEGGSFPPSRERPARGSWLRGRGAQCSGGRDWWLGTSEVKGAWVRQRPRRWQVTQVSSRPPTAGAWTVEPPWPGWAESRPEGSAHPVAGARLEAAGGRPHQPGGPGGDRPSLASLA